MRRHKPNGTGRKRTTADAVEAAIADEDRTRHLVSSTQFAEMIGKSRKTISEWIDERGCPTDRRGGGGEASRLDPAAVFAWREQYVREDEARKYARPSGPGLSDPDDPYKGIPLKPSEILALEKVKLTKIQIGREAELLVYRLHVGAAYQRALGLVRQTMMAIPERITRKMVGQDPKKVIAWREDALGYVRSGLSEAEKAIQLALPEFKLDDE